MVQKMYEVKEESELCGNFLEWLRSKYDMIDKSEPQEKSFIPIGYSSYIDIEKLLAEYFDIDLDEVEREKEELINELKKNKVID